MRASIKFRDEQKPLLRAKIPLSILNFPFRSGISAGDSKELCLNLATFFESGPSIRFSYRPNDSHNPFSLIFKSGIGPFGSPARSPLIMTAEFNLIGNQNPSFFIHFKPNFGDFTLKKSHSSDFVKNFGERLNGGVLGEESFVNNGYLKGNGFFPATAESKAAAGMVVNSVVKGAELSARTALPLRDFSVVNFRWGLRFPPQEAAGSVVVGRRVDRISLPLLVMDKIGIEHVAKGDLKEEKVEPVDSLAKACSEVKKQLDMIQAENGLLSKALSDLRADMAAGKMDFLSEAQRNRYSGSKGHRRANAHNKSLEAIDNDGLKAA